MEHFGNEFTTIFYLIDAANSGKTLIRVLSEDTNMFFLTGMLGVSRGDGVQSAYGAVGHSVCSRMACTPSAIAT